MIKESVAPKLIKRGNRMIKDSVQDLLELREFVEQITASEIVEISGHKFDIRVIIKEVLG